MKKRGTYNGKTRQAKDYYAKTIKNQDYEPTVDETINFPETDDVEKDFSLPKSTKKRKPKFKQVIIDHFNENWLYWVVGIICIVIFFYMVDAKVDIKGIDTRSVSENRIEKGQEIICYRNNKK